MDDKQNSGDTSDSTPWPSVPAQVHFNGTSALSRHDCSPNYEEVRDMDQKKEVTDRNTDDADADNDDIHELKIPELPAYSETKIRQDWLPKVIGSSYEPDLEAGFGSRGRFQPERIMSDFNGDFIGPTMPPELMRPGYIDTIHVALADVANRATASESPYYVRQFHIDAATSPCMHDQQSVSPKRTSPLSFLMMKRKKNAEKKDEEKNEEEKKNVKNEGANTRTCCPDLTKEQYRLLKAYFEVITHGIHDLLIKLLDSNLVDANTSNYSSVPYFFDRVQGKLPTPLVTAIQAKNKTTTTILLEHGADINGWSTTKVFELKTISGRKKWHQVLRTPLQVAAQEGNLTIVKLLMEKYGADDSLIAPTDGQTALRLAVDAKHRDIVAYLPTRRGGTRLRCRAKWHQTAPKMHKVIAPTIKAVHLLFWRCPVRILKWTAVDLPNLLWECAKHLPPALWKLCKAIPTLIKESPKFLVDSTVDIFKYTLRIIRRLPAVYVNVSKYLQTAIKQLFTSISKIITRLMSLLHTAFLATTTFFRTLTLTNLLHALQDLMRSIFIDLPHLLVKLGRRSMQKSADLVIQLFGMLGVMIWILASCTIASLAFFPTKAVKFVRILVGFLGRILEEVLVWLDPKRI